MKQILATILALLLFGCVQTEQYKGGGSYTGQLDWGERHGQGTYTWPDGTTYTGQWKNGKKHGRGTMTYNDGSSYTGSWQDGKKAGQGIYRFASGSVYDGWWHNDNMHGSGRFSYANGGVYEGSFRNDKREGEGRLRYANGSVYVGSWKNNQRHGVGKLTYTSGDTVVGEFQNGKINGKVTRTYAGGDRFSGSYKAGKWHGKAEFDYVDGSHFSCIFKDGKLLGPGIYTTAGGRKFYGMARAFVTVTSIVPNTQAVRLGLKPGDIFLEYNGSRVRDTAHVIEMVKNTRPSDAATLKILRANRVQNLNLSGGRIGVWFQNFPRLTGNSATSCAIKSGEKSIWVLVESACKGDWANGTGKAVTLDMRQFFEGRFENGWFAEGKYTSGNRTYEGTWRNGRMHGYIVKKTNGSVTFKGHYVDGNPHGEAMCSYSGRLEPCTYNNGRRTDELYLVREKQQRLQAKIEQQEREAMRERERQERKAREERERLKEEQEEAEYRARRQRQAQSAADREAQMMSNVMNHLDKRMNELTQLNRDLNQQSAEINRMVEKENYRRQQQANEQQQRLRLEQIEKENERRMQQLKARQEADRTRRERQLAELQRQKRELEQRQRQQRLAAEQNRLQQEKEQALRLSRAQNSTAGKPATAVSGPSQITRRIGAPDVSAGAFSMGQTSYTSIRDITLNTCRFAKITAGLHYSSLMGEFVGKYGIRMTPAPGADTSSIRNLKVRIALTGSGRTAYVTHTSVNLDKTGGSFSFDVGGATDLNRLLENGSGRYYDRKTAIEVLKKTNRIYLVSVEEVPY